MPRGERTAAAVRDEVARRASSSLFWGQLAIWAIDLAHFSSILLLKRPFHDITGRTMANPASTPTDAVGSSPADSESREAATRPQNAPLATTATAGHHGPRTSPDGGGGMSLGGNWPSGQSTWPILVVSYC